MSPVDSETIMMVMILALPILAIIGGVVMGVVRTLGQQRVMELAQKERIAAIERGLDPAKLPPLPDYSPHSWMSGALSPHEYALRRSHGLLIGGIITLMVGIAVAIFLSQVQPNDPAWLVGMIPGAVGIALLLSAWIVHPRDEDRQGPSAGSGVPR